ncbi:MAG: ATP-binding protein [Lachnospiraceae bacterium]|nr:ATP-binding protein [Lachnospiraceae bacterium]
MIKTDIKSDIMRMYESETIELKEVCTPDLKKKVVHLHISTVAQYIGVQDNEEITGLENADFVIQQISYVVRDSIRLDVSMITNTRLVKREDKNIIKITVHQGTKEPYVYVRSGMTTVPASEDAIHMS